MPNDMNQENSRQKIREPVNVCSKGIGVVRLNKANQEFVEFLIHKNTSLPAEAVVEFKTQTDNQIRIEIQILEQAGETESPKLNDNTQIGFGHLVGFPNNLPAGSPIFVTFRLEDDGTLKVIGVETSTMTELNFEIKIEGGVMSLDEYREKHPWTFDQNKYQKEILIPAVAEFTKNGNLPDAFARYSLDPRVSNLDEIQLATKTVLSYWNKSKNHPRFEKLLKVLIDENKEIVQELTDEKAREALQMLAKEERRKRRAEKLNKLNRLIKICSFKGFLTFEENDKLEAVFIANGLTQRDFFSCLKVPIEERIVRLPEQGLEEATRRKIRNNLATLGKTNLYEFLDIRPSASKEELEKRYQELVSELDKRINDNKKYSAQALLAIVKDKLVKDGLEKYEKALVWDVIDDELRILVEFAAVNRMISREQLEMITNYGIKFGLSREQATEAILWLAHEKGAVVDVPQPRE